MASTIRVTRVIAASTRLTRQWRHFCTDQAQPSISTPTPTPSTAPPKRRNRKSSRSGSGVSRSRRPGTQAMWDSSELMQLDEFDRKRKIFLQKKPTYKEMKKFFDEEYDKMQRNETKYPGEVTKILEGNLKGWRVYKPTLEAIPSSIPENEGPPEWRRIFMENRERWYKEGLFDIIFEGNVFELGMCIEDRCLSLTESKALGYRFRKGTPI